MKNIILHNAGWKLLSVLLALLLWLTVMNVEDPTVTETISDIPVQIVNDDVIKSRGYGYTIESGEKIDIKVKGRRSVVDNVTADDFTAIADFSTFSKMKMVTIEVSCKDVYAGELTWTAKTDSMAIVLEEEVEESRGLRFERIGEVKEGYYLYDLKTETTLVKVKGAKSQVEKVKEVVAEVNVEGLKDSSDVEVALFAVDSEGTKIDSKKITLDKETINAQLTIYPIKTIPLSVLVEGEPAQYYYTGEVEFAPKEIQITGEENALNLLESITISVDVTGAWEDIEKQVNIEEYLDENYQYMDLKLVDQTTTMGIKVPVIAMTEKILELKSEDIEVIGMDVEKYKYIINTGIYSRVIVRGKAEEMTNIEPSDFGLYIDVNQMMPAEKYNVEIKSSYDGNLIVQTGTVELTIVDLVEMNNPDNETEGSGETTEQ
ncbi:MAG: hypothetical protein IKP88_14960 [Lachnospiraceae bacterium]|nr:hypothetical protein [Lachnospiraceae bacterium]